MDTPNGDLLLLVEDDDVDAMSIERAIKKLRPSLKIVRAENGKRALEILEVERPKIILMDIRMPQMNGREALSVIKQDNVLRKIPVIMMSTSTNSEDIEFCYQNYSNAYLVKPFGPDESTELMNKVLNFWFDAIVI